MYKLIKLQVISLQNANEISSFAVVFFDSGFYYFGGYTKFPNAYNFGVIARLDSNSFQWSKIGQLNKGRSGHNAILIGDEFLIVGGYGTRDTEKCKYNDGEMVCSAQSPTLDDYGFFPELFAVPDDFCE